MSGTAGAYSKSTYFSIFYSTGVRVSLAVPKNVKNPSKYIGDYFEKESKPFEEELNQVLPDLEKIFDDFVHKEKMPLEPMTTDKNAVHFDGAIIEDTDDVPEYIKQKESYARAWFDRTENPMVSIGFHARTKLHKSISVGVYINNQIKRSDIDRLKEYILPLFSPYKLATPKGVEIIYMPNYSGFMKEGVINCWHKKVGDYIKEGDILAELETDKSNIEYECFYAGTLLYAEKINKLIPVDGLMAIIGPAGTDVSEIISQMKMIKPLSESN